MPKKRDLNPSPRCADISAIGSPDVFDEITAVSLAAASMRDSTSFLTSIRSTTTSMTQSAPPIFWKSSSKLPNVIRFWAAGSMNGSGFIFVAALKAPSTRLFLAPSRPMLSGVTSKSTTSRPALARCAAIWLPITPAPTTAAVRNGLWAHGGVSLEDESAGVVRVGVSMLGFRVRDSGFRVRRGAASRSVDCLSF